MNTETNPANSTIGTKIEYTDLDGGIPRTEQAMWTTAQLVDFGNYLLSDRQHEIVDVHFSMLPVDKTIVRNALGTGVSHADLENWYEKLKQTNNV